MRSELRLEDEASSQEDTPLTAVEVKAANIV